MPHQIEQRFCTHPKSMSPSEHGAPNTPAQDAENVSLPCSICNKQIPEQDLTNHLEEEHQQLICPVCCQMFDKNVPGIESYFQCHVEIHFDPVRYPHSS